MKNLKKRTMAGVAIAGAALVGITGLTAGAAEAGKLPGATKTKSFDEGSVQIRLFDEAYSIRRAVTNIPTSREIWVSGKVRVTTNGGVKGGNINVGYLVGCQLDFGAGASGGIQGNFKWKDIIEGTEPTITDTLDGTETGVGFKLSPGEAAYVPVIKSSSDGSFNFGNARGGVAYSQERFGVDGCAGYAQARAKVTVRVSTDTFRGNITTYGAPFSLG